MANTNHRIKISADFKQLVDGTKVANNAITQLAKTKYKINIDDTKIKAMGKQLLDQQDALEKRLNGLVMRQSKAYELLQKAQEKGTNPQRVEKLRNMWGKVNDEIKQTSDQLNKINNQTAQTQSVFGRFFNMATKVGAGITAAYMFAAPRRAIAEQGLALMGAGAAGTQGEVEQIRETGIQMGFGPAETLRQARDLTRQVGGAQMTGRVQRLARQFGMGAEGAGQLTGALGQLRRAGFSDAQGMKRLEELMVRAQVQGFEKSRAIDYAKEQIGFLENISKTGEGSQSSIDALNNILSRNAWFGANAQRVGASRDAFENMRKSSIGQMAMLQTLKEMRPDLKGFQLLNTMRTGIFEEGGMLDVIGRDREGKKLDDTERKKAQSQALRRFAAVGAGMAIGRRVDFSEIRKGTEQYEGALSGLMATMKISRSMASNLLDSLSKGNIDVVKEMKKFKDANERGLNKLKNTTDFNSRQVESQLEEVRMDTGDVITEVTNKLGAVGISIATIFGGGGLMMNLLQLLQMRNLNKTMQTQLPNLTGQISKTTSRFGKFVGGLGKGLGILSAALVGIEVGTWIKESLDKAFGIEVVDKWIGRNITDPIFEFFENIGNLLPQSLQKYLPSFMKQHVSVDEEEMALLKSGRMGAKTLLKESGGDIGKALEQLDQTKWGKSRKESIRKFLKNPNYKQELFSDELIKSSMLPQEIQKTKEKIDNKKQDEKTAQNIIINNENGNKILVEMSSILKDILIESKNSKLKDITNIDISNTNKNIIVG